jgi:hypothetical protein
MTVNIEKTEITEPNDESNNFPSGKISTRREVLKSFVLGAITLTFPGASCSNKKNGAGGVSAVPAISFEITFSNPMDTDSVRSAMSISPDVPGFFNGIFEWSAGDTVLYYKNDVLKWDQVYTITIAGTALDKNGLALDGNDDGVGGEEYDFEAAGV